MKAITQNKIKNSNEKKNLHNKSKNLQLNKKVNKRKKS